MRFAFLLLAVTACSGSDEPTRVSSYGSDLKVSTGVLGGAAPKPGACSTASRSYTVSLATGAFHAKVCPNGVARVVDRTLTSEEVASVRTALDRYTESSQPDVCGYDGTAYSLTVGTKEFWDSDYNCQHRTDIGYVSQGLGTIEGLLESLAK